MLTGLGLALVLALVAALVGPWFVDWNAYRQDFAAQASALVGAPVTVAGEVDARLLPSPYVRFRDVVSGGEGGRLRVAEVEVTLGVGALLRGEIKAERITLVRPQLAMTVGRDGIVRVPFSARGSGGADADRISFERAEIVDGAITIEAPVGRTALARIDGVAEAGSLKGPFRFEGRAGPDARRITLKLATGRADGAGALRVKLSAAIDGRPETLELDGALRVAARPSFDGEATLTRLAPKPVEGKPTDAPPHWRVAARMRADPLRIAFEELDAAYGPDERSVRVGGRAQIELGAAPRFQLALGARQIDLDRMAGASGRAATPRAILEELAARFAGAAHPPMPGRVSLDLGSVVLAGDVAQDVRAVLSAGDGAWRIQQATAQLPAGTTVAASGAVVFADAGPGFAGHVDFSTAELGAFRRWLEGGGEPGRAGVRRFAAKGDVTARLGAFTIENAALGADGAASSGRLSWRAAENGARSRVEATLKAEALDLDALGVDRFVADALRDGSSTDVALVLDAETLTLLGLPFSRVGIEGALDTDGLDLKRLSVGDIGGAALSGAGRIVSGATGPEGLLAFDVDARAFTGLTALARAAGLAEPAVATLERRAAALAPAKLAVDVSADADGRRIELRGQAAGGTIDGRLSTARFALDAPAEIAFRIASSDGARLMALAGLSVSPLVKADGGELRVSLKGAPDKGMAGEARLAALGLDAGLRGTAAFTPAAGFSASGDVAVRADDLGAFGAALGRLVPGAALQLPATLTGKLAVGSGAVRIEALNGQIAGRALSGRLTAPTDPRAGFEGEITLAEAPFGAVLGLAFSPDSLAPDAGPRRSVWPAAVFGPSPASGLTGRLAVRAARLVLTPGQTATDAGFILAFKPDAIAIDGLSATFAGGRLTGAASVSRAGAEATLALRLALTNAQAETLFGAPARVSPLAGRLDASVEAQGTGRTFAGLVAALAGTGSATLRSGQVRGLDVAALDRIEPRIEAGLALETTRIAAALEGDLGAADLPFDRAVAPFTLSGGVVRSGALANDGGPARLGGSITLDLSRLALDADVTLAPRRNDAPQIGVAFEGPLAAPKRRVEATALTSWLSVRAVERETRRIEAMEAELQERARLARERAAEEERRRVEERRKADEARLLEEEEEEARRAEQERRRREAEDRARLAREPPELPPALDLTPPFTTPARPRSPAPLGLTPARPADRAPPTPSPFQGILEPR